MIFRIQFRRHGSSGPRRRNPEKTQDLRSGAPRYDVPLLADSNLSSVYFPARGFAHSLLIHAIIIGGVILIRPNLLDRPHHPEKAPIEDAEDFKNVIYLPLLQSHPVEGANHLAGFREGRPENRRKDPPAASARGAGSFSYPGPQPILSEFPEPTNRIQTVLQPELENPPVLTPPLLLPNFIQLADARPEPPMPDPVNKPAEKVDPVEEPPEPIPEAKPEVKEAPPIPKPEAPPVETPKLPERAAASKNDLPEMKPAEQVKPAPVPQNASLRVGVKAPEPEPKPVGPKAEPAKPGVERKEHPKPASYQAASVRKNAEATDSPPKPVEQKPATKPNEPLPEPAPLPSSKNDAQNVLALTPMPAQRKPDEIPRGEAHGNFAISPTPNLAVSETQPGFKSDKNAAKSKIDKPAPAGNVVPGKAAPAAGAASTAAARSPEANGTRTGSAPGGTGSSSAIGSSSAKSPFQGITVYGAVDDAGETIAPASNDETPFSPQKSYGYTIISTEASGGGLPSLGVFSQEQFYTVYLDMRQSALDSAPSWILEYAPYGGTNRPNSADDQGRSQQGLVLPFPVTKQNPDLPQDLVRRHLRQLVIVYAVVNADGRMEQVSITETPDALLNQPVLDALRKWVFRPGELNGQPVAMKVLVGIPLWPVK